MPIYRFCCEECGEFEMLLGYKEKLEKCPECDGDVERRFTLCKVHYNAPGFTKGAKEE